MSEDWWYKVLTLSFALGVFWIITQLCPPLLSKEEQYQRREIQENPASAFEIYGVQGYLARILGFAGISYALTQFWY